MKNKVTAKKDFRSFRVYIDGLLHMCVPTQEFAGLKTWVDGDDNCTYFIEFNLKSGGLLTTEYESKELWVEILKQLDDII